MKPEFRPFPKMPRLSRECIITEKIDGTNASVCIMPLYVDEPLPECSLAVFTHTDGEEYCVLAGSRNRWITPEDDNMGFAAWVRDNADQLQQLGPGHHFGEWWGRGIQRNYGLIERRFSLFNVSRWALHGTEPQTIPTADPRIIKTQDVLPPCCGLVPVLYRGEFSTVFAEFTLADLAKGGSKAAPGFMKPEGVCVYHIAGNLGFKKTIEKDSEPKGKA